MRGNMIKANTKLPESKLSNVSTHGRTILKSNNRTFGGVSRDRLKNKSKFGGYYTGQNRGDFKVL